MDRRPRCDSRAYAEALARVQAEAQERAFAFEEELHRELLSLDQTLRILELYEWQRDPDHFDLTERAKQVVVISEVSLKIFIASAQGRVRTIPGRPSSAPTSAAQYFRYEASLPADDGRRCSSAN